MARKKVQTRSGQSVQDKNDRALKTEKDRERRIMNSMANTSIILMSTMMGAFTEVMMKTTGAMASGMAEAISGKQAGEKANEEFKQKQPEVDEKIKRMISDMRKDIYTQLGQKSKKIKQLLSDTAFDAGPKTIEKYDFGLPKLTEELDAGTLAQYTQLLVSEDPNFAEMFKELTRWMETLPKLPEKTKEN
jgi:valyl-tRNA synthetase